MAPNSEPSQPKPEAGRTSNSTTLEVMLGPLRTLSITFDHFFLINKRLKFDIEVALLNLKEMALGRTKLLRYDTRPKGLCTSKSCPQFARCTKSMPRSILQKTPLENNPSSGLFKYSLALLDILGIV